MSTGDTYFVMHFLNGAPKAGEAPSPGNPDDLHITFLAHIQSPDRFRGEMMLAFYDVADITKKFDMKVSGTDSFGKFRQYQVVTLDDFTGAAKSLHNGLLEKVLRIRGAELVQPDYAGEFYSSHITVFNNQHGISDEDIITVDSLTLVRHIGGLNGEIEVLANVTLDI